MHASHRKANILAWAHKKHLPPIVPPLLLSSALLLAGCAPEEKTLLLTTEPASEEETELAASSRDFTVKKIYTYAYETRSELNKSAFLQGCDNNEIHIIALEDSEGQETLAYRQVDYRYGFYDTVGEFLQTWENWNNPEGGEMEGDLYIQKLLPSPDGKVLLAYVESAFWDTTFVWLYTLEGQKLLLYEGDNLAEGSLQGSFSPSGRWATFDAAGISTGGTSLVPVYDCHKNPEAETAASWSIPFTSSRLSPPDQVLYSDIRSPVLLCETMLCDTADGQAGLVTLAQNQNDSFVSATRVSPVEDFAVVPDASLLSEESEMAPSFQYQSCYLYERDKIPYLQYKISDTGNEVNYLETPHRLSGMDMDTFTLCHQPREFPGIVWDFLRLDSGEILAAIAQETNQEVSGLNMKQPFSALISHGVCAANPYLCHGASAQKPGFLLAEGDDSQGRAVNQTPERLDISGSLAFTIQRFWGIQSADLYFYPNEATDGQLLYKNLQNLISMEYDQQNGRILLETYEGNDLSHRKCILLEL